ncbi:hypothetical protein GWK47_013897 [Chionoecetes opilio]|uniref:Uncharacterized protein n=1 Tax=Chionoecetes opilio TaxID=41210 RepID=A0A8J4Y458_CHIOP|nr:hypothetical protein GWK47_013897 [Chionoecetes opilio]
MGALKQHIMRTHVQARIWCQASLPHQDLLDPLQNGYHKGDDGQLKPTTTSLPPAPKAILEMVYAAKHDIVYNTTKTECMVVSPARTQVDYLKQHGSTTKLLVVGNTLQRKFSYCSREVKMEIFRSHCYSIYCNSLWSRFKVATLNRLKVCHNDILKRILGLPRWCSSSLAFARNGVNNLDVIRRHSVFSLRSRVELSTNSIITSVRQSSAYVCGPIQQWWLGLLFVQNVG